MTSLLTTSCLWDEMVTYTNQNRKSFYLPAMYP
jgi:hypothetical protein